MNRLLSWRHWVASTLLFAAFSFCFFKIQALNFDEHIKIVDSLKELHLIRSNTIEDLLRVRTGLLQSYDSLALLQQEAATVTKDLKQKFLREDSAYAKRVGHLLAVYEQQRSANLQKIERFKSANSVVQNSLRYLPHAHTLAVSGDLKATDREQLDALYQQTLIYALNRSALEYQTALDAAQKVEEKLTSVNGFELRRQETQTFFRHTKVILDGTSLIDAELLSLTHGSLHKALTELQNGYDALYLSVVQTKLRYQIAMYVLFVVALLYLGLVLSKLHNAFTALREINANLEERVALRTTEITKSNQSLERQIIQSEQLTEELRAAKEMAETSNSTKSEFLANMSHEIRTPMNGIIGMTELTLATELTEEQKDYIVTVRHSAHSLLRIINDILDFSKAEAGKLTLEPKPFEVRSFVQRILMLLTARAREKRIEIVLDIDRDVPIYVIGDDLRLGQIIINLFGNAIKFTPEQGGIVFNLSVGQPPSSDPTTVILNGAISDSGIGIPADQFAKVFEPFTQADNSTSRKFGGTGLGLSISKRLAELMGGAISGKSIPGVGSTFAFSVSVKKATGVPANLLTAPAEDIAPESLEIKGCRILLAEDNPVNQKLMLRVLGKRGCVVSVATNGREVLEALYGNQNGSPFELILMDSDMPEMSGVEATQCIREKERQSGKRIPIVALTAHAMSGDREKFLAAGMDDYVSKPISIPELVEVISRWRGRV